MTGRHQHRGRDVGSATVEFALVLPVVMLVLIGSIQVVSLVRTQIELTGAAREGARVAATMPDPSQAASAARAALSPPLAARTRVAVRRPAEVGSTAEVVVSSTYQLLRPVLGGYPVELRSRAAIRAER